MNTFIAIESEEEERYVRTVSDNTWISVLYRLTGFGYWEWETAIRTHEPETFTMIRGDRRAVLAELNEADVLMWAKDHAHEKTSFDTLIQALSDREAAKL